MRVVLTLLLLFWAPTLHAQTAIPAAAAEEATLPQQVAAPLLPGPSAAEPTPTPTLHRRSAAEESAAAVEPIFDRAFWRSVLAGVIASVLTALILRAIL